ncbi:MAG TPA: SDR family oxidoreductase [Rhabdochlamydiaceae bacterium]|nr:SDR family oxidoreductase [Rhabdochlamydiaceae bacterium]HSX38875.1 SDR family oxidoreductase [Chlamydiales bacterium]
MKTQKTQPGLEYKMDPKPRWEGNTNHLRLRDKTAIITGGDSGIGRAVAFAFAKEGADLAIIYLDEHKDARETRKLVESEGRKCLLISCDVGIEKAVKRAVQLTMKNFGKIDIVVNNAAEQIEQNKIENISEKQLENTFRTNIFSYFFLIKHCIKHLKNGATIINTTSVTAYRGSDHLLDYASTKGAIVSFTRSLSANLVEQGIRVNAVAPGPIWTPLIVASFTEKKIKSFGKNTPMKRAGQPEEVAPCYVFLASEDSSYMTGQVLHPNGGEIING